jgi:predicted nucleic acid-binding protein
MTCMSDRIFVDTNVLIYAHAVDARQSMKLQNASSESFGTNGGVS